MKPHQALEELEPLTQDKNAINTKRFKKCYTVVTAHIKMLEKDNRLLRTRHKSQRKTIDVLINRIRRDSDE